MKLIALVLLSTLVACSSAYVIQVNPTYKKTFSPSEALQAGDKIDVFLDKLNANEQLQFHLCDLPCAKAFHIQTIASEDFSGKRVTFTAPRAGRYYFWLHNTVAEGSDASVEVVDEYETKESFVLEFSSGAKVIVYK